jgi:hypothetical protein
MCFQRLHKVSSYHVEVTRECDFCYDHLAFEIYRMLRDEAVSLDLVVVFTQLAPGHMLCPER